MGDFNSVMAKREALRDANDFEAQSEQEDSVDGQLKR